MSRPLTGWTTSTRQGLTSLATKSLPDRIHVLVAVQPARLAMRVSQGDLRVRCQDHDLDDCEEGGVHVILPGTRGQSLLAGPWLVEVQFNIPSCVSFAELSDDIFESLPDDTAQTALKTRLELTGHQSVVGSRLIELSLYVISIKKTLCSLCPFLL